MTLPHADWIVPDWPAPARVRALVTTRAGGESKGAYAAFNLGLRSGEDASVVMRNRERLAACLPSAPCWMNQVHGVAVADLAQAHAEPQADAAFARIPGQVCVVMTADCLPVLLCDRNADAVAVAHAGWRGLAAGVIGETVKAMAVPAGRLMAWLGPAISQDAYEVGPELRDAFVSVDANDRVAFKPGRPGKFHADLYALARNRLLSAGVQEVYGGGFCTYRDAGRFYSYRRDGAASGRMASLIWLESLKA